MPKKTYGKSVTASNAVLWLLWFDTAFRTVAITPVKQIDEFSGCNCLVKMRLFSVNIKFTSYSMFRIEHVK